MRSLLLYTVPALIVGISVYAIPNPTPEELIERENRQAIMDCLDTLSGTSLEIQKGTIECSKIPFRSITGTGQLTPVSEPPSKLEKKEEKKDNGLNALHEKVCKKQINSPLCKDRALFDRLYQITEERLPEKQFFPILLGMTNSESSLGLDMAKDNVGGRCFGRNNWGGAKYQIHDDNTRTYKRELNGFIYKYPRDQYNCNLYPFESIDEYWISKVNGIKYGYKHCIDSKAPLACISVHYVGSEKVVKPQWVRNASLFLD